MKKILLTILLRAGLLVLAACTPAATLAPADSIQGITWQWTSLTNQSTG